MSNQSFFVPITLSQMSKNLYNVRQLVSSHIPAFPALDVEELRMPPKMDLGLEGGRSRDLIHDT